MEIPPNLWVCTFGCIDFYGFLVLDCQIRKMSVDGDEKDFRR